MRWKTLGAALLVVVGIGAAALAVVGPNLGGDRRHPVPHEPGDRHRRRRPGRRDGVARGRHDLRRSPSAALRRSRRAPPRPGSHAGSTTGATSSWIVETVAVTPGQAVVAGDVLATADTSSAELDLAVAEANLLAAKARLASDQGGLTATERASALLQVTQARQQLANAQHIVLPVDRPEQPEAVPGEPGSRRRSRPARRGEGRADRRRQGVRRRIARRGAPLVRGDGPVRGRLEGPEPAQAVAVVGRGVDGVGEPRPRPRPLSRPPSRTSPAPQPPSTLPARSSPPTRLHPSRTLP